MHTPTKKRATENDTSPVAKPLSTEKRPKPRAVITSIQRRPHRSVLYPATAAPTSAPASAMSHSKFHLQIVKVKSVRKKSMAPEMTLVSYPKIAPPRAATAAVRMTVKRLEDPENRTGAFGDTSADERSPM